MPARTVRCRRHEEHRLGQDKLAQPRVDTLVDLPHARIIASTALAALSPASLCGFDDAASRTRLLRRGFYDAASTRAAKTRWSAISSGCHCTPRANRRS